MRSKDKIDKVINGEHFRLYIDEDWDHRGRKYRLVRVWHWPTYQKQGHGHVFAKSKYTEDKGGFFRDPTPLPSLESQIAETLSEAVANYFDVKELKEERNRKIQDAVDIAAEVWEEELAE